MKLKQFALPCLMSLFSSGSYAQSSTTLYGIIDNGLTYISNQKGHANYVVDTGIMQGDRFGFRGVEDLGGGLSTIFQLENGFNVNTGAMGSGAIFGRQAFIGFEDASWGRLTIGRQYDPMSELVGYQTLGPYVGLYNTIPVDADRTAGESVSNAAKYYSPVFYGFKFGAMFAFSNQAGHFGGGIGAPRMTNFGLRYDHRNLTVAAGYMNINGTGGSVAETAFGANSQKNLEFSIKYDIGAASLLSSIRHAKFAGEANGATSTATAYEAGALYHLSPALLSAFGYTHAVYTQGRWGIWAGILDYALSKRTDVYVSGTYEKSYSGNTPAALVGAAGIIGTPGSYDEAGASSNDKQLALRIGIRTKF
ncbi:outer membrane protein (porin) [Caballeronia udeis]|uniref:Outer membrane protein (Porin) n=1 Tax=Caballeronia udeis TaxID=1232866 RepID=A0A158JD05_9BURK|nr:porin [Caballeronia udeis]SAL66575.1 outer membrane protein (porin) [Caballeronia udeis]